MTCERCGCRETTTVLTPDGPHHSRVSCANCGAFVRYGPQPMTWESRLRFGTYLGKQLAEVPAYYLLSLFRRNWLKGDWPVLYEFLREHEAELRKRAEVERHAEGRDRTS